MDEQRFTVHRPPAAALSIAPLKFNEINQYCIIRRLINAGEQTGRFQQYWATGGESTECGESGEATVAHTHTRARVWVPESPPPIPQPPLPPQFNEHCSLFSSCFVASRVSVKTPGFRLRLNSSSLLGGGVWGGMGGVVGSLLQQRRDTITL